MDSKTRRKLEELPRSVLLGLCQSELVVIARELAEVELSRALPEDRIVDIIDGEPADKRELCPTVPMRRSMEEFLRTHRRFTRQLPGCDACCTSWGCPPMQVVLHYDGLRRTGLVI